MNRQTAFVVALVSLILTAVSLGFFGFMLGCHWFCVPNKWKKGLFYVLANNITFWFLLLVITILAIVTLGLGSFLYIFAGIPVVIFFALTVYDCIKLGSMTDEDFDAMYPKY